MAAEMKLYVPIEWTEGTSVDDKAFVTIQVKQHVEAEPVKEGETPKRRRRVVTSVKRLTITLFEDNAEYDDFYQAIEEATEECKESGEKVIDVLQEIYGFYGVFHDIIPDGGMFQFKLKEGWSNETNIYRRFIWADDYTSDSAADRKCNAAFQKDLDAGRIQLVNEEEEESSDANNKDDFKDRGKGRRDR